MKNREAIQKAIAEINAFLVTENLLDTPSRESLKVAVLVLEQKLVEENK